MNEIPVGDEQVAPSQDPMRQPIATITWCGLDIKQMYPDWTDDKCIEALESVAGYLEERSIEIGWEVLGILLSDYERNNND